MSENTGLPEQTFAIQPNSYTVECFSCASPFDAQDTIWCNCLTSDTSLVCPKCLHCFCKAPRKYKDQFWSNAPQKLWDKKKEEERMSSIIEPNPEPEIVKRPLVFIVENNRRIQQTAKRLITELGYGTIVASNGEEGILVARDYLPDVILTAALMPKLDGRQMCRLLKSSPRTQKIKIVVMTELYTAAKYRAEAFRRFKVDEYIAKPVSFDQLTALLEKFLNHFVEGAPPVLA